MPGTAISATKTTIPFLPFETTTTIGSGPGERTKLADSHCRSVKKRLLRSDLITAISAAFSVFFLHRICLLGPEVKYFFGLVYK
jgi:hypothetical protein